MPKEPITTTIAIGGAVAAACINPIAAVGIGAFFGGAYVIDVWLTRRAAKHVRAQWRAGQLSDKEAIALLDELEGTTTPSQPQPQPKPNWPVQIETMNLADQHREFFK